MNKKLQDIFTYHEETKHSHSRYARSLGYMDWANQPNPYRSYQGAKEINLPLALQYPTPPYHLIFTDDIPKAPLLINSVSQFLQFSLGLAAIKSDGHNEWALRCNASSGNLHPSEAYLILPPLDDVSKQSSISHYAPKNHSLEILTSFDSEIWNALPNGSFFIAISSIVYREVWKYGERAFRYTQLDAGHAQRSLQISAKVLGWRYRLVSEISNSELSKLLGFDQKMRFHENENEIADMLILITPDTFDEDVKFEKLLDSTPTVYDSIANRLAQNHQIWPLISTIENVTDISNNNLNKAEETAVKREPTLESKKVIMNRRSAQMMNKENSQIELNEFLILLHSTNESFNGFANAVNLLIFVHNVKDLKQGLYIYFRNEEYKDELKNLMSESFLWEKIEENLYALEYDDFTISSKNISCSQDIAKDGAFSLGMLSPFSNEIIQHGTRRYKELYWECGAIGQQLYLEATSIGLSATGIGCYLDDSFHKILGLKSNRFQSLYHFTVGRALSDSRLLTKKPYEDRL